MKNNENSSLLDVIRSRLKKKSVNKLLTVRNVYVPSEKTIVSKECIHQKITQLSCNCCVVFITNTKDFLSWGISYTSAAWNRLTSLLFSFFFLSMLFNCALCRKSTPLHFPTETSFPCHFVNSSHFFFWGMKYHSGIL